VEHSVELPHWPARSGEKFLFRALTVVVYVDFVVGRDVGYRKIWTIWMQAMPLMSRLVRLINIKNEKSGFQWSIKGE